MALRLLPGTFRLSHQHLLAVDVVGFSVNDFPNSKSFPLKADGLVKSPPSRHSREGGSLEVLEIPGFPFSRNDRKGRFSTFYEAIKAESLQNWTFFLDTVEESN